MLAKCETCPEAETCKLLGVDTKHCPRNSGREIPLSDLTTVITIDEISDTAGSIFCSSPDHGFKRQARAKIPSLNLPLEKETALMLMACTDREYTFDEVSEVCHVPFRQLLYLSEKAGLKKGFGK
ncbi:MAG: hypothetical protein PHU49_03630 [Syntrophorhabdaceae bacterium]|nr:hypothetical protein [Syntrophorhabdaceae bacterium]MDD5243086.1 hypothetical protein [Syntrophorhabdaceae bacterium]